jgi:TonB family protein
MSRAVLGTLTAATFLTMAQPAALAQNIVIRPAGAASAPTLLPTGASKETPEQAAERARRQAEGPMYWIRMNAQKAGDDKAARPAPPAGAAAARAAPAPTPAPAQVPAQVPAQLPAQATNPPVPPVAAGPTSAAVTPPQTAAAPAQVQATASSSASTSNGSPPAGAKPDSAAPAAPELRLPATANAAASTPPAGGNGSGPLASALPTQITAPPQRAAEEPTPDQALQLVAGNEPRFPDALMRRLRKGSVNMRVDVGTDGKVIQVAVVNSSHPRLEQAAIEAAQGMRFQPLRKPTSGEINFSFDLDS